MPDFSFTWLNPLTQFFVGFMLSPGELTYEKESKTVNVKALQIGILFASLNFVWKAEDN
jgi:hypothetical protein